MIFKAWVAGMGISILASLMALAVHTPFELVGTILSVPGMIGMAPVVRIARSAGWSERAESIASFAAVILCGSIFYGLAALLVLRVRARRR